RYPSALPCGQRPSQRRVSHREERGCRAVSWRSLLHPIFVSVERIAQPFHERLCVLAQIASRARRRKSHLHIHTAARQRKDVVKVPRVGSHFRTAISAHVFVGVEDLRANIGFTQGVLFVSAPSSIFCVRFIRILRAPPCGTFPHAVSVLR